MVPNGWSKHKFYEIVRDTQLGTTERHKGDISNNQIPLLKMGNLSWGEFNLNSVEQLPREKVDSTLLLKKGDFLFNTRNTPELVGKSAVWNDNLPEATFDNNINRISFKNGIDPFYMAAYLNNGRGKAIINSLPAGSTSVAAIYWKDLKNIQITLPPLPEQRKIAKILSTWDKAISTTEKLIETSKQQKKALMQQLLTGKKRLVDPETGMMFEGEWKRHAMSDLVFIDRKSLGKRTLDDFEFQYISLSDVAVGSISKELEVHKFASSPSRARRVIQEGDILLSTVRPNLKGFAKVSGKHADCIASTGFSVLTPKKRVNGDYIYQYIFSSHVTGQIDSLVVGSNYPAINSSDVAGLKVYCPTYEEQQKIASVLTAADKEIELLQAKLAHFKQEKKALMQQLLTGKRRVKVEDVQAA